MISRLGLAILATLTLALTGCATPPQPPVDLAPTALTSKPGRVGVAMTRLPKVDTHLEGAGCLLCMAAAAVANNKLTTHTQTLGHEDLGKLKDDFALLLKKKGVDAVVIAEEVDLDKTPERSEKGGNVSPYDFSALKNRHQIDKLLLIDVRKLGMVRTYSGYVPTSEPKGAFQANGYLIDLGQHTYQWYQPVYVLKSADGNWDEPPTFPGLTNAYFQALETGKDSLRKPFSN